MIVPRKHIVLNVLFLGCRHQAKGLKRGNVTVTVQHVISAVKPLKLGIPAIITVIFQDGILWLYSAIIHPNDTDGTENSEVPDQTAPLGAV